MNDQASLFTAYTDIHTIAAEKWLGKPADTRARRADPETSLAAAPEQANALAAATRRAIYTILKTYGPLTDEQIAYHASVEGWYTSPSGLRTRRSELVERNLVQDSGQRARTTAGRATIIWKAR